ncbi:hypothetical protein PSTG_12809 [Puccinia striiformis f. sp. tritici PST-78]|uniref:DNA 3'-5' helicase n=1 Tax=Puccinia striiformis f. sp. tritici PST-78 TaxID=1165861 RepID=A0A0L0V3B3_9BASI|nr:hypothetical protein PSTG_12809 [Puccinia striiformis f. sp. tritici PST-78]
MKEVRVTNLIRDSSDEELRRMIELKSIQKFKQKAKPLQVETVLNLLRGRNTFVLAATGFGKSRISELYLEMLPRDRRQNLRGVVVVLNPLDALGDNQVAEKIAAGFTAINLTQSNFSEDACLEILEGAYNFVYLSPEIFLNNEVFCDMYFSTNFQSLLALVVVDEAHMIYAWGLVEGGQKKLKTLVRHQDFSAFRPCYGCLASQLLTKNNAPLLLMSATCRPAAIEAIKKNLKLLDTHIDVLRGELTRPEICIIRLPMTASIQSCEDLSKLYGPKDETPDDQLVPSLIYHGTRKRTLQGVEVLAKYRGTPRNHLDPRNTLARRYHACTGDLDKKDTIEDFSQGKVPILSCTLALGMGQNWSLVRQVVHIGRGDPSLVCQMVGRCGRDGRPGLAILFVEPNQPKGKNKPEDFTPGQIQSDEDRMDALAVTPVCLRIAFSMDNLNGYIPLDFNDPLYQAEVLREQQKGFPTCMCSNCMPHAATGLVQNMKRLNRSNFTDYVLNLVPMTAVPTIPEKRKYNMNTNGPVTNAHERARLEHLKQSLQDDFNIFFRQTVPRDGSLVPTDLFGDEEIQLIINYFGQIETEADIQRIIKGESMKGQAAHLMKTIKLFKSGRVWRGEAAEAGVVEKGSNKAAESGASATQENEDVALPSVATKRPRKNAISPEERIRREEEAARRKKIKEKRAEDSRLEQEYKKKRAAQQAQIRADVKKERGII